MDPTRVSSARTHISYPTYLDSPVVPSDAALAPTLKSRPEATPTVGSANAPTSARSAPFDGLAVASTFTTISPLSPAAAAFSAAVFPARLASAMSATPRSEYSRAIASVASVLPSEMTSTCRRSGGYSRERMWSSVCLRIDASLCTGIVIVIVGSSNDSLRAGVLFKRRPTHQSTAGYARYAYTSDRSGMASRAKVRIVTRLLPTAIPSGKRRVGGDTIGSQLGRSRAVSVVRRIRWRRIHSRARVRHRHRRPRFDAHFGIGLNDRIRLRLADRVV